jgi:ABC-type polysaccharide/polyol phosphate transport system ATPase subunit
MSDEVMIRVDNVSKKYCSNLKRSLRYGLYDLADELLLKRQKEAKLRKQEFWALRSLSFELKQGESLGVIGVNGSGKTTLLKMLQGLIKPSKGTITVRGQVGALISLGAGFQPILSGRENIYINAAILGVSKRDVNRRLNDIIEFAGIGDFIDAPVRGYSSGMKARLGFSIATNLVEPDVLLIDEVLAAGDMAFKYKCMERMKEVISSGATIVFVSHSIRQVERLCQKTLLLNKGIVEAIGPSLEVCQRYYELSNQQSISSQEKTLSAANSLGQHSDLSLFEVKKVKLLNEVRGFQENFQICQPLVIHLSFIAHREVEALSVSFQITTLDNVCISAVSSRGKDHYPNVFGNGYVECVVPEPPLREGIYLIGCTVWSGEAKIFRSEQVAQLSIIPDKKNYSKAGSASGLVYIPTFWDFGQTDS